MPRTTAPSHERSFAYASILALACVVASCGRRGAASTVAPDPTLADAAHAAKERAAFDLLHGRVIDLKTPASLDVLETDLPSHEAFHLGEDGDAVAYLLAKNGELHAYDMRTAKRRWSAPGVTCASLAAIPAGAVCASRAGAIVYDASSGATRTLGGPSAAGVTQILVVARDARLLLARDDRTLESFDGATLAALGHLTLPSVPPTGQSMVETIDGACAVSAGDDLLVTCFDAEARSSWTKKFPLLAASDPPATRFVVRQVDRRWVVASSASFGAGPVRRGVVVRLVDGAEVARVAEDVASVVAAEDGSLDGLLVPSWTGLRLLETSGATRWTDAATTSDSARALLVGDAVVVASFDRGTTGADLQAFDRRTGARRWRADVELLPIDHSRYHNEVDLSIAFDRIVMRGRESGQTYLEIFRPSDGARLLSEVRSPWK